MALAPVQVPVEKQLRDAWNLYLVECNAIPDTDYDALEPFAWRRLRKRLKEIGEYVEYRG